MTRRVLYGLAAIVCVGLLAAAPRALAKADLSPDGPYPVGVRILHLDYEGRQMPVMVWYPAEKSPGQVPYDYLDQVDGTAVKDAEPDRSGAPYPFILFSHGMGGCGQQSVFYTENLASMGYVVAAPDHYDAAMCHIEGPPDITMGKILWASLKAGLNLGKMVMNLFGDKLKDMNYDFSYRPAEGKAVIDFMAVSNYIPGFLQGLIDEDRIGVTGHSLGGYTSLMLGGVPFFCDQPEDQSPQNCDVTDVGLESVPNLCCFDYIRNADPFSLGDKRIKAMLPLGPVAFFPHLERAAAEVKIPFMIITGDDEKMEVPFEPLQNFYEYAPAPKYLIRLVQTDHMAITDVAYHEALLRVVLPGFRSHFDDKVRAYKDYSVGFFNLYLKGEGSREKGVQVEPNPYAQLWAQPE